MRSAVSFLLKKLEFFVNAKTARFFDKNVLPAVFPFLK